MPPTTPDRLGAALATGVGALHVMTNASPHLAAAVARVCGAAFPNGAPARVHVLVSTAAVAAEWRRAMPRARVLSFVGLCRADFERAAAAGRDLLVVPAPHDLANSVARSPVALAFLEGYLSSGRSLWLHTCPLSTLARFWAEHQPGEPLTLPLPPFATRVEYETEPAALPHVLRREAALGAPVLVLPSDASASSADELLLARLAKASGGKTVAWSPDWKSADPAADILVVTGRDAHHLPAPEARQPPPAEPAARCVVVAPYDALMDTVRYPHQRPRIGKPTTVLERMVEARSRVVVYADADESHVDLSFVTGAAPPLPGRTLGLLVACAYLDAMLYSHGGGQARLAQSAGLDARASYSSNPPSVAIGFHDTIIGTARSFLGERVPRDYPGLSDADRAVLRSVVSAVDRAGGAAGTEPRHRRVPGVAAAAASGGAVAPPPRRRRRQRRRAPLREYRCGCHSGCHH